jgi:hypothetical protein
MPFRDKRHCDITLQDIKDNWEELRASVQRRLKKAKENKGIIIPIIGKLENRKGD